VNSLWRALNAWYWNRFWAAWLRDVEARQESGRQLRRKHGRGDGPEVPDGR